MNELIAKLSKQDQKGIKMALIHAKMGNFQVLDSMIRASNTRSESILKAIKAEFVK